ncbi:MAG: hypothetical protein ACO1SX_16890, partial [Actinomycetota bacterium]
MPHRSPSATARGSGVLLCLLAIGTPLFLRWLALPSQRSVARFEVATFGQYHQLFGQVYLGRLGVLPWPPGGGQLLGRYNSPEGSDELALWLSPRSAAVRDRFWDRQARSYDEHGCQIGGIHPLQTGDLCRDLGIVALEAFPRRSSSVTLRFWDRDNGAGSESIACVIPKISPAAAADVGEPVLPPLGSSCRLERFAGG